MNERPRGPGAARPWTRATLPLLLAGLLLTACSSGQGLPHTSLDVTVKDREISEVVTVHGVVTDFPVPAGAEPSPAAGERVVLADVTVALGGALAYTVDPSSIVLRSASGETAQPVTTLDDAMIDQTLWPLREVTSGQTRRGWLAFTVGDGFLDGAEVVVTRPPRIVSGVTTLPVVDHAAPLGLG